MKYKLCLYICFTHIKFVFNYFYAKISSYSCPIQQNKETFEANINIRKLKIGVLAALISATAFSVSAKDFLNVSYDPTRELYDNFNKEFSAYWKNLLVRM